MNAAAQDGAAAPAPPALDVVDGLVQLSFIVQAVLGRVTSDLDLSVTQARMLAVIEDRDIGMRQLAGILELEKSSVTGLVDRAERRGLVRRVAVSGNRRSVHVALTPTGRSLVTKVRRTVRAEIAAMTETLGTAQRDDLSRSVTSLIRQHAASHAIPL